VLLVNSGFVLFLLFTLPLHAFVVERTLVTWLLMGGGIAISTLWFVRVMRRAGIMVSFGSGRAMNAAEAGAAAG
jgi:hypothetical protein